MPVVSVKKKDLDKALGKVYTQEEFELLCFDFGIELDDVTSEKIMKAKEKGEEVKLEDVDEDEIIYKIEVPANRYDLLCLEGIGRALRIYLCKEKSPIYKAISPKTPQILTVAKETADVRPIVVGAILRDITFNQRTYDSFIELQDKLHQNICRRRTLVSIGTHDLDTIKGPFSYEAREPKNIKFAPLNSETVVDGVQLFENLRSDKHLKPYLHIIEDSPRYPVIYDANGVVLSLPPIINGNHSKITLNTKNVLIEITGTDLTKCKIVLDVMITMFSEYCKDKFTCEELHVKQPDGTVNVYPDFKLRTVQTTVDYITRGIGVQLESDKVIELLDRMQLPAVAVEGKPGVVEVTVPVTRSDILHPCDVMEDVAIAYGFNNLVPTVPKSGTIARQQGINKLTDLLRMEVALSGFTEILTHSLVSREENYDLMKKEDDNMAVVLANPQTVEFQLGRTSLLPGALKTLHHNSHLPLPIRVFEISDVMLRDDTNPAGAKNERHLVALNYNKSGEFQVIHGLLDRLMLLMGRTKDYHIKETSNPTYFERRCADIFLGKEKIGTFGLLHPDVINGFLLKLPVACLEINIEPFLQNRHPGKK